MEPLAVASELVPPSPPTPTPLRVLQTDPGNAMAAEVGSWEIGSDDGVEGVYLDTEQLVVLTSSAWWGHFGSNFTAIEPWANERHGLRILDLSDPGAIEETWRIDIEGALVASRRIGDRLLLVGRHFPAIEDLDFAPADSEAQATNQARLDALTAADLLPRISINGRAAEGLLDGDRCLVSNPDHPLAPERPGYPVLTTIVAIDLGSGAVTDALCYAEPVDGVYVSGSAIYLAYSPWESDGNTSTMVLWIADTALSMSECAVMMITGRQGWRTLSR